MPDNQQNQSNAASISSNIPVDIIEESMQKIKIEEGEEGGQLHKYPRRPGETNCSYYMRTGLCDYRSNCRFNHPPNAAKTSENTSEFPQREGEPECGYYMKTGNCKYRTACKYHHPLDRHGAGQDQLNTLGLPIRQEEKSCPYYLRNKICNFGPRCKFNHPELPSGSATAGTIGPVTPEVMPCGAFPAWSVASSPYMASSRVAFSPLYMPFGFSPNLQGPIAPQSCNGYMGNLNAVSASNGYVDMLTMAIPHLPERPGLPECWHFMSSGTCNYGSNCKFHHPKERTMNNLGPHGLPLRPGEDICAYFQCYGICNPYCKFNHPFGGYIDGYYFGMTSMPIGNLPPFPSQMISAIANSSATTQSKSSKITDWIRKPETVQEKNHQTSEVKCVEDLREPVDHKLNSTPTSELAQEQVE